MNKIEELERIVADLTERLEVIEHVLDLRRPAPQPDRAFWDFQANDGHGGTVFRCAKHHNHTTVEEAKMCQETP